MTCLQCYVPSSIPCVLLAGYASMCPSDYPALFSFALPHTCNWIPPDSAAGEWSACRPAVWCWLCALVAQACDGWLAMLACVPLTTLLCVLSPYPTHASGSLLILQQVGDRLASRNVVLVMCPRCADVRWWLAGYPSMCPSDQPALFSFAVPNTCIWIPPDSAAGEWSACCLPCGACCVPSMRGCVFLPGHVVYTICPCCPNVWCWPAMLACAPLTSLHCFLSTNTTHASGSRLILKEVSGCQAARHVVLVMSPCFPDVLCWPAMLAGYASMCPSDEPALFSFALPHTCIWFPPISAAGEWPACCPQCGAGYVPWLPSCVLMAGRLC